MEYTIGDWRKIDRITKAMDDVLEYENILTGGSSVNSHMIQGDRPGWYKPAVDLQLVCFVILPGQWVATVAAL